MNNKLNAIEEDGENENEEERDYKEGSHKVAQEGPMRPTILLEEDNDQNNNIEVDNRFTDIDSAKYNFNEQDEFKNPDMNNPDPSNKNSNSQQGSSSMQKSSVVKGVEEKKIEVKIIEYEVAIIGEYGVGKTSMMNKLIYNSMTYNNEDNDITSSEKSKILNIDQTTAIKLIIHDTDGTEKNGTPLPKQFYKDIHAAIIVFDLTEKPTFDRVEFWTSELNKAAPRDCVIMLIGNKSDCPNRKVSSQEIINVAQKNNFECAEVSASTGNNIALAFDKLANKIHTKQQEELNNPDRVMRGADGRGSIKINPNYGGMEKKKKKCC